MKIFGTRETKGGTHTRRIQRRPRLWDLAWTMFHWGEENNKAYRRGASWSLFWAGAELSCAPMVQHPDILVKYLSEIPAEAWCVRLWWSRAGSLPGIFVGETRSLACTRKTYQTSEAFLPVWKRWCSQKQGLNYADIPFMVNRLEVCCVIWGEAACEAAVMWKSRPSADWQSDRTEVVLDHVTSYWVSPRCFLWCEERNTPLTSACGFSPQSQWPQSLPFSPQTWVLKKPNQNSQQQGDIRNKWGFTLLTFLGWTHKLWENPNESKASSPQTPAECRSCLSSANNAETWH